LRNELAEGHYKVGNRSVSLTDIRVPVFAVGTAKDHVAPWKSVYKIHLLFDTDVTFLLTSGGHNAGIVSEPGHRNRAFQASTFKEGSPYVAADEWSRRTPKVAGSWWPYWSNWLAERSGSKTRVPEMGKASAGYAPLADAPGSYVLETAGPIPEGEWATLSEAHLALNPHG
jgi:polyhydroxyalkanoate synthase